MDRLPKFHRIMTHLRSNNSPATTDESKQAVSGDKVTSDNQSKDGSSARNKDEKLYLHLPVIFDRRVSCPYLARHDDRSWNSVLVKGDVSHYDRNYPPNIVNRTSQQNSPEYKGKGKAAVKSKDYYPTPPIPSPNTSPHSERTYRHQTPHTRITRPVLTTYPIHDSPPLPPPLSRNKNKDPKIDLSTHTPNPSPSQSPPLSPTAPSISFACASTTVLPTDSPVLVYGSCGQRRRVLMSPNTINSTAITETRHRHSPTSSSQSPGSDRAIIPVVAQKVAAPCRCPSPPFPLSQALPACNRSSGRGRNSVFEARFSANVCDFTNGEKDERDSKDDNEGSKVTLGRRLHGQEKEKYQFGGAVQMSAYRPPSVHTVPNTPSQSQISIPRFSNDAKQGNTHESHENAAMSGPGASRTDELRGFTFPFQPSSARGRGLSTLADARYYDNDAAISSVSPDMAPHNNASTHSFSTTHTVNHRVNAGWQECEDRARGLEAALDAMDGEMRMLSEENKALWESVEFCDRVLRIVRDRDLSIYWGLHESLLRVRLREETNGLEEARRSGEFGRVRLRRWERSSSVEGWDAYRGQRWGKANGKVKGRRRLSWLKNFYRKALFAGLRSSRRQQGSSPAHQYMFGNETGSRTWVVSDELSYVIEGDDRWCVGESPTPSLTQELASLLGFAQSHMQKLEEDVADFEEREGYCRDLRRVRLTRS